MKTQIPLYRAKKIDSDEYVEGDLFNEQYILSKSDFNNYISESINHIRNDILTKDCINEDCKNEHMLLEKMLNKLLVNERFEHIFEIGITTLSIHLPDMLANDSDRLLPNGDKDLRIFASLSEDGKGGSIINDETETMIVKWDSIYRSIMVSEEMMFHELNFARVKVIGIQE